MPNSKSSQRQTNFDQSLQRMATAAESAGYTHDILVSLGRLAAQHKQTKLGILIEAAAGAAQAKARSD